MVLYHYDRYDFLSNILELKHIKLEFLLSDYIERSNVSGWIEQENWFILNFYNIIKPDLNSKFIVLISSLDICKSAALFL